VAVAVAAATVPTREHSHWCERYVAAALTNLGALTPIEQRQRFFGISSGADAMDTRAIAAAAAAAAAATVALAASMVTAAHTWAHPHWRKLDGAAALNGLSALASM
jgi:hypothetical protein